MLRQRRRFRPQHRTRLPFRGYCDASAREREVVPGKIHHDHQKEKKNEIFQSVLTEIASFRWLRRRQVSGSRSHLSKVAIEGYQFGPLPLEKTSIHRRRVLRQESLHLRHFSSGQWQVIFWPIFFPAGQQPDLPLGGSRISFPSFQCEIIEHHFGKHGAFILRCCAADLDSLLGRGPRAPAALQFDAPTRPEAGPDLTYSGTN